MASRKTAKKTAAKKAPAKKVTKKAAPKPASGAGGPARSATRGGHVDADRYSKDPSAVNDRVSEKADKSVTQLANMIARFEAKGDDDRPEIKKARKAIEHLEAAKKALA